MAAVPSGSRRQDQVMRSTRRFGLILFCSYLTLVWPIILWPVAGLVWFFSSILHETMAISFAVEFAEHLCACWFPQQDLPVLLAGLPRDATAVLMVTCDDYSEPHVKALLPLARAGYRVF